MDLLIVCDGANGASAATISPFSACITFFVASVLIFSISNKIYKYRLEQTIVERKKNLLFVFGQFYLSLMLNLERRLCKILAPATPTPSSVHKGISMRGECFFQFFLISERRWRGYAAYSPFDRASFNTSVSVAFEITNSQSSSNTWDHCVVEAPPRLVAMRQTRLL